MIRTLRIWLLLRKLQKMCHLIEKEEHHHTHETGHSFRATIPELEFLAKISNGNAIKHAEYTDLLDIAEKKMKLLETHEHKHRDTCNDCGCESGPPKKCIRLNDDGLEFVGLFDFIEYTITKYKLTWGVIATIFLSPVWFPFLSKYIFHPACIILHLCNI